MAAQEAPTSLGGETVIVQRPAALEDRFRMRFSSVPLSVVTTHAAARSLRPLAASTAKAITPIVNSTSG